MHIAIVSPMRAGACGGFAKHLPRVIAQWERDPRVRAISAFLPDGVAIDGLNPARTYAFPSADIKQRFRTLRGMVAAHQPDVALLTIGRYVDFGSLPVVTMVRNAEPLQRMDYPCSLYWHARVWMFRQEHRVACTRATRVLAVSEYIRQQIIAYFGTDSRRIDVVPHGIDQHEISHSGMPPVGLQPGFLFTAGVLAPYRGVEDLIRAVAQLKATGAAFPPVVIAGDDADAGYVRMLDRLINRHGLGETIHRIGKVTPAEMIWCYKHCLGFICTSRAEACPNIVLESLAHGCATISCDHQPMPEFYGDTAWYYPSGNSRILAERIATLLAAGKAERLERGERARVRGKDYSWERTANGTLESLVKAVGAETADRCALR